eukprot:TRINITY_DN2559_c0_g1_i2.p1 TRINITY_DN2559_c0_g1~~TRINITY_DN2559_c0_g1_i2.p1  ORF type:complete len:315 (-),score=112.05 TRINITY_DN2559_c0_g1_i2:488-1432(-)
MLRSLVGSEMCIRDRYKKREPKSAEEQELAENCFDILCSCLMVPTNQQIFLDHEGLELMLIMVKEKGFAKRRALKVLNFALKSSPTACDMFVSALGNKSLFAAFMRPGKGAQPELAADEENAISCIAHLLQHAQGEARKRTVLKFSNDDSPKIDRLLELHIKYSHRMKEVDVEHTAERLGALGQEHSEEIVYLAKLDAGLYTLQLVDLVWGLVLFYGRADVAEHTKTLFHQHRLEPTQLISVLEEYLSNLGDDNQQEADASKEKIGQAIRGLLSLVPDPTAAAESGDATPETYAEEAEEDGDATPDTYEEGAED